VTGAALAERLKTVEPSNEPVIELPFTDQNGEPYRQIRPPESRSQATLPFPDANGNLVVVPIAPGPRPQTAGFPVYKPESAPAAKKSGAEQSSGASEGRRPGGGG